MTNSTYPAASQERSRGRTHGTAQSSCAPMSWHKWRDLLPALRMAREALGLNKSRLDLLEKMLACLPGDTVSPDANGRLIVFASNARLAEMTHRDSDKTITRLITELVERGLVERRSSPNGKRFSRQGPDGQRVAYGLDLGPMLARKSEIEAHARTAEAHAETCRRLREACSLMIKTLAERAGEADAIHSLLDDGRRRLRRKPDPQELSNLHRDLAKHLSEAIPDGNIHPAQDLSPPNTVPLETPSIRANAPQTTCHKDTSNIPIDKTSSQKRAGGLSALSLTPELVERTMPRVATLGRQIQGSLRDLIDRMLDCLGINQTLWQRSLEQHGFQESSLVLMTIYERQRQIRHAPGYFSKIINGKQTQPHVGSHLVTSLLLA